MKARATLLLGLVAALVLAVIDGTSGNDRLRGSMNADVIRAFAGNDVVTPGPGTTSPVRAAASFTAGRATISSGVAG
ncbi:MAG TPA: hypothetical protein VJM07_05550 [Gaiella sp.]|nr:hypothetical protein [Gaiella sp.]